MFIRPKAIGEVPCALGMVEAILDSFYHPLYGTLMDLMMVVVGRSSLFTAERRCMGSFVPTAMRLFDSFANGRQDAGQMHFPLRINEIIFILILILLLHLNITGDVVW